MIAVTKDLIDLLLPEAARRLGVKKDKIFVEFQNLLFTPVSYHVIEYDLQGRTMFLLAPPVSFDRSIVEFDSYDKQSGDGDNMNLITNKVDYTSYLLNPCQGFFFDNIEQGNNSYSYIPVLRFTRL